MNSYLARLIAQIQRFMIGRYGPDNLFQFLCLFSVALALLSRFFGSTPLRFLYLIPLLVGILRLLSRNFAARRRENAVYCQLQAIFLDWLRFQGQRWRDRKTHRYFTCPNCRARLRVPRGKGKIELTCNRCGHHFRRET